MFYLTRRAKYFLNYGFQVHSCSCNNALDNSGKICYQELKYLKRQLHNFLLPFILKEFIPSLEWGKVLFIFINDGANFYSYLSIMKKYISSLTEVKYSLGKISTHTHTLVRDCVRTSSVIAHLFFTAEKHGIRQYKS